MKSFFGLLIDVGLNIITFGWWGRDLGEEIVWVRDDGFGRPGKD